MLRLTIIAALVLVTPASFTIPASAAAAQEAPAQGQGQCDENPRKKAKRSLFGGVLGGIAGGILGGSDLGGMASLIPVGSIVADELIKLLDCKEQKQAASATNEAIKGGVGTEVRWQSETRKNVTGSSKVTAQQQLADGTNCMTVTDVVIIDGEETTVPKRMCRGKGDSGYRKA